MQKQLNYRIENLSEISRLINSGEDLDTILDRIVYAVCRHSDWMMSAILTVNETTMESRIVKRFDPYLSVCKVVPERWDLDTSPLRDVVRSNQPLIIVDALNSDEFPTYREDAKLRGYRTVVILLMDVRDTAGHPMILTVQSRELVEVTDSELSFLTTVADLAAIAVDKAMMLQSERQRSDKLHKAIHSFTNLMQPILSGSTVEAISGELSKIIDAPWVVFELYANRVVANRSPFPEKFDDQSWKAWVDGQGKDAIASLIAVSEADESSKTTILEIEVGTETLRCSVAVQPLTVDAAVVGCLVSFEKGEPMDHIDSLQTHAVRLALCALLMRNVIEFRTRASSQSDAVRLLFASESMEQEGLSTRLELAGLQLSGATRFLLLTSPRPAGTTATGNFARLHQAIAHSAEITLEAISTVEFDGCLVAFIPAEGIKKPGFDSRMAKLVDLFKKQSGCDPVVVVSEDCEDLSDYPNAYKQCERLIRLARLLSVSGIVTARDFGSLPLMLSMADEGSIQDLLSFTIGPLLGSMGSKNRKLLETAKCFVENEGRFQNCAEQLGIHVSTLRYRLEKIDQDFALDLSNSDVRFDMQFAFKLHNLMQKFEKKR